MNPPNAFATRPISEPVRRRWMALALLGCSAGCAMTHGASVDEPVPERCDLLDDDGDGRIDEGLPLTAMGERIRVRTDEGSTGPCSRCQWARSALTPTGSGMALVLRLYSEGEPTANVFFRRLGSDGRPLADVDRLFDEAAGEWFPSVHSDDGAVVIGTHAQGASVRGPMLVRLDREGLRAGDPVVLPLPHGRTPGTWATPRVTTLPDGTLQTAFECRGDVCVAAIDEDGATRGQWALSERTSLLPGRHAVRLGSPVLAQHASRVGVAVLAVHGEAPVRPELLFALLDADGTVVREHRIELPRPDFENVPINTARILADDDGFLVMFLRRDCTADERNGRWVVRFDGEGELVEGPTNHEPSVCFYDDLSVQRRAGSGLLISGTRSVDPAAGIDGQHSFVAQLDAGGRLEWVTTLESDLHSVLELADGRVMAAISTRQQHGEANPIDVVELRCAP